MFVAPSFGGGQKTPKQLCLRELCFRACREHFAALGTEAVLDLPALLIQDLLPHLTICQLDELQPALNQRGISTHPGWAGVLEDMCGPNHVMDFRTEEEAKHEVMRMLFTVVFYGFTNLFVKRNEANLNTRHFLSAAAKCVKRFLVTSGMHKPLQSLTAERRPLLDLFEKCIRSVLVVQSSELSDGKTQPALYVLHRLLDHGVAEELVAKVQSPILLAWLLHGRGSQYVNPKLMKLMHSTKPSWISQDAPAGADGAGCSTGRETGASEDRDDRVPPCKRSKLDSASVEDESGDVTVDPQVLCQSFAPCEGPSAGACPRGQIKCLEIRLRGFEPLTALNSALPTFFCLRSLSVHSVSILMDVHVLGLARALKRLSESARSSLTHLSVAALAHTELIETLLDASPNLTSLHTEIQSVMGRPALPRSAQSDMSELALEELTLRVIEFQSDLHFITTVLRRSPRLTSLHVAGMRLPTGSSQRPFLTTISESNHSLRSLNLEDLKLSDCLPEIFNLLRNCKLEELSLNDCRLLEKSSDKKESLQQLVAALKTVPSLHTLSLAQNRLAKNVSVLAELFSGSSPSSVTRLDVRSNFIQPADLQELAAGLMTHRPLRRLTLDLRRNPGDRDAATWNDALQRLSPFCVLLVEEWKSTDTMVDHISNM